MDVYSTPEAFLAAEFRPKVIGTVSYLNAGFGCELDMVRIGDVHLGPGVGYILNDTGWVGGGVGCNVWKNLDVGGYGGKVLGNEGWTGGVSVGIAIEGI